MADQRLNTHTQKLLCSLVALLLVGRIENNWAETDIQVESKILSGVR